GEQGANLDEEHVGRGVLPFERLDPVEPGEHCAGLVHATTVAGRSARLCAGSVPNGALPAGSALGEVAGALELHADERLVADDPRVVTRRDVVGVAGADLDGRPVVVLDADAARERVT